MRRRSPVRGRLRHRGGDGPARGPCSRTPAFAGGSRPSWTSWTPPPTDSPAYTPGPAGEATIRELIGRYHEVAEHGLQLKLGDAHLADASFQEFWTRLLTHTLPEAGTDTGHFRDYLRTVLHRIIIEHFRKRELEPPASESRLDEAKPDAEYDGIWREGLIKRHPWRGSRPTRPIHPRIAFIRCSISERTYPKARIEGPGRPALPAGRRGRHARVVPQDAPAVPRSHSSSCS